MGGAVRRCRPRGGPRRREAAPPSRPPPHRAAAEGVVGVQRRTLGTGPRRGVLRETRCDTGTTGATGAAPPQTGRTWKGLSGSAAGPPRWAMAGPGTGSGKRERDPDRDRRRRRPRPAVADWSPHRDVTGTARGAAEPHCRGPLRTRGAGPGRAGRR